MLFNFAVLFIHFFPHSRYNNFHLVKMELEQYEVTCCAHCIMCTVVGSRQFLSDLAQGGLEILHTLLFMGKPKEIDKLKLLKVDELKAQRTIKIDVNLDLVAS